MKAKDRLALEHPMYHVRRPLADTHAIERVGTAVTSAIEQNSHGMKLVGNTQRGKTHACVHLDDTLDWRPYPMAFCHIRMGLHDRATENYLYTKLLACAHLKTSQLSDPNTNLSRVVTHLVSLAEEASAEVIIMPIDEAQRLHGKDFEHLHTLDNEIEAAGKRLFVVLITQIDYVGKEPESILSDISRHAAARFLQHEATFIPVYGWKELRRYLKQYDKALIWPVGSGVTYTQYFAPLAFAGGWRFYRQAKQIWRLATKLLAQHGLNHEVWAWPMKTLETFVAYMLTRVAGEKKEAFLRFTRDEILQGLAYCGFVHFEQTCPSTLDPRLYVTVGPEDEVEEDEEEEEEEPEELSA
jgi:hypothetical protein